MIELSPLCAALSLDEATCREAVERPGDAYRHSPVYIQALLAVGAWIAAILVIAFVLTLLAMVVELDTELTALLVGVIAVVIFGIGAAMQRGAPAGGFGHHFASALLAAGVILLPAAGGGQTESFWAAARAAAAATLVAIGIGRDRPAQFLAAALAMALIAAGFAVDELPYLVELAALAAVAGALLTVYPPRLDIKPAATVLLLFMPCLMVVLGADEITAGLLAPGLGGEGWAARAIQLGVILWLLYRHRTLSPRPLGDAIMAGLAAAAVVVGVLLPPGGSAALMLMMLAFVLGLRGLALIGVLFQIYFIGRYYYDLQLPLLDKSLLLMAVGAAVLGAYALVARRADEPS
jgi:hypothetical protein